MQNKEDEVLDAGYATYAPPGCDCRPFAPMDWYNEPYRYFMGCMSTRCMIRRALARPYNLTHSVGAARDDTASPVNRTGS